jgi:radical SAM superfamily enzyme YgiQ (UPF0313 family)
VERFCELLLEKKWDDFVWVAQARVDTVKRDVLRKMKRAGCIQLDFGVESGSQTVLNTLRKGTKLNQIKQAFNIAREEGIRRFASFVIGTPGESIEDVELTESLIDEIKPDFTEFYYLTPYPGTELYEYAIKHNLIDINVPYNNWAASKQADEPVMHNDFTKEELIRIRSRLHNKVFSRNYVHIPLTPSFLVGMLSVLKNGMSGVPKGFKRFLKTGKLDSIPVEVVRAYRNNMRYRLG